MEITIKNERLAEEIRLNNHENRFDWKKKVFKDVEAQQRCMQYAYGREQYRRYGGKGK